MAKRTVAEQILHYETRRDSLETKIEKQESFKSLEGQGVKGAKTDFTDPQKLYEELDRVNNRLSVLYRQQG